MSWDVCVSVASYACFLLRTCVCKSFCVCVSSSSSVSWFWREEADLEGSLLLVEALSDPASEGGCSSGVDPLNQRTRGSGYEWMVKVIEPSSPTFNA